MSLLPDTINSVIEKGRVRGHVDADDLVKALEDVELSPSLIEEVIDRLEAEAVPLDAEFEVEVPVEPVLRRERPGQIGSAGTLADPVRAYLQSINNLGLLTQEKEKELAQVMAVGQDAKAKLLEMSRLMSPPPRHELLALQESVRVGQDARSQLVEGNLRLVVSIAKRYRHRGISFLDLIQEGNAGLVKAVEKFDVSRGFRLSTYATWWIRQALGRCVADQARTIRIPVHVYETLSRVLTVQRTMLQEQGREPSFEELAKRVQMPEDRVRDILAIDRSTVPLESEGDDAGWSDKLGDTASERPDQAVDRQALGTLLDDAMASLNDRERELMALRFGLKDGQTRSLEEVGKVFGVSRERVRQIESKTFEKLRTPLARQQVEAFLED